MPPCRIATHKADSADVRVVADEVHTVVLFTWHEIIESVLPIYSILEHMP